MMKLCSKLTQGYIDCKIILKCFLPVVFVPLALLARLAGEFRPEDI